MTIVTGSPRAASAADEALPRRRVLLPEVDVALVGLREPHRDLDPLDEQVRPQLHDVAVLDRPGLALVGVHDHDARAGVVAHGRPLPEGRESGAAVADEPGGLELGHDPVGIERGRVARLVRREQVDRRTVIRRVRHGGHDLVAAHHRGSEVAVADARHLDRARALLEQRAAAEAVADRPRADPDDVGRQAQVRVERGHLGHLAAADVHVVGERVRELGRDRAEVPADPAEVVEELRALARKLVQPGRHAPDDSP